MLVVENGTVLSGSSLRPERTNIVIEDGLITEITPRRVQADYRIDASGLIVAPALINSHVHVGDSVAKDVGDGKSIEEIVRPPDGLKHRILETTPRHEIVESMKLTIHEMLNNGTGAFIDYREGGVNGVKMLREAAEKTPIGVLILGRDPVIFDSMASPEDIRRAVKKILKVADGIAPSGMGEISDEAASIIVEECRKRGKVSSIHVGEHIEAQKRSIETTGRTEVQRAIEAGFELLVHLTNPMKGDLELVASSGASVVLCPRSNGLLGAGIPPVTSMQRLGINLLLGTDNVMFNSPNLFREMEYTLKVTRASAGGYFSPLDVLKMTTVNAAKLPFEGSGCIMEGQQANIMVVEKLSGNLYLSLINRTESKNIIYLIIKGKLIKR